MTSGNGRFDDVLEMLKRRAANRANPAKTRSGIELWNHAGMTAVITTLVGAAFSLVGALLLCVWAVPYAIIVSVLALILKAMGVL